MRIVTGAQMRDAEAFAINELGIPALLLMENAALKTVCHIQRLLEADGEAVKRVAVVCGPGNNGGDGLAAARLLFVSRIDTVIVYLGNDGESLHLSIARKIGIPILPYPGTDNAAVAALFREALVVDALFGTGLNRAPEGFYAEMIRLINEQSRLTVSVDIPSGLQVDTGQVLGEAVKAHTTVTFGFYKPGLLLYPGAAYAGDIRVEDISIPHDTRAEGALRYEALTASEIPALLPARPAFSHKGSYGRVVVLAGSLNMPGAAVLCCAAAYRAGAGLVEARVLEETARAVQQHVPEALTTILPGRQGQYDGESYQALNKITAASGDVLLLGPGLGRGAGVTAFVRAVLEDAYRYAAVILDADGLNAAAEEPALLKRLTPCAVTPHPGEMSRLTGLSVTEITQDPVAAATAFAQKYGVITLLKGARTVIASPDGVVYINISGNASMAKAGSGDALAGIIAGLAAQHMPLHLACAAGAFLHGIAGEQASQGLSLYGVNASDIINELPRVLAEMTK